MRPVVGLVHIRCWAPLHTNLLINSPRVRASLRRLAPIGHMANGKPLPGARAACLSNRCVIQRDRRICNLGAPGAHGTSPRARSCPRPQVLEALGPFGPVSETWPDRVPRAERQSMSAAYCQPSSKSGSEALSTSNHDHASMSCPSGHLLGSAAGQLAAGGLHHAEPAGPAPGATEPTEEPVEEPVAEDPTAVVNRNANVRTGPSTDYAIAYWLTAGDAVTVVGRNEEDDRTPGGGDRCRCAARRRPRSGDRRPGPRARPVGVRGRQGLG
jgi:hypothetical protein